MRDSDYRYKNPYAPPIEELPEVIPVFPLYGVLLLPKANLPLNIFEDRYLAMIRDAMASHMMIGIVQPRHYQGETIYSTGCAGKITSYQETEDGRFLIELTGICRFIIKNEIEDNSKLYRTVKANWNDFSVDLTGDRCSAINREKLNTLLEIYFDMHGLECDWEHINNSSIEKLVRCLSMICPLDPCEKQMLLESKDACDRGNKFMAILEMAVKGMKNPCCTGNHQ